MIKKATLISLIFCMFLSPQVLAVGIYQYYKQEFHDPFVDYRFKETAEETVQETAVTSEESIFEQLPFRLLGIIGNENRRLALIQVDAATFLLSRGEKIGDFQIKEVYPNGLLLQYQEIAFTLDLGSGQGAN